MTQRRERQRRCILTGEEFPARVMIRLVAGPSGELVPDLAGRLPGRGVWLQASSEILSAATRSGELVKAASRGLKCRIDDSAGFGELAGQIESGLTRQCLSLMGMARGAGFLALGYEKARSAITSGAARLMICANDAGPDSRGKLERLVQAVDKDIQLVDCFDRLQISLAIGRENSVYAVVTNTGFAERIADEALRLAAFRGKALRTIAPGDHIGESVGPGQAVLEN